MRCAIYTRKSADEAPDARHSTIDNQRDLCATYIASQVGEGWIEVITRYDDVGWSGANLARPALETMLQDIAAGKIDLVVVYKIDRLSRSLRDFLDLVDQFERAGVGLVSTTQNFSTSTSMGRLTLNMLLSFAQFERELIGERSRDWKAGARAKGLWTSGPPPFGYQLANLRLEPHPERARIVRWIYRRFIHHRSYGAVAKELVAKGVVNRLGRHFDGRMVKAVVTGRVYLGELCHRGECRKGIHRSLVSRSLWANAAAVVAEIEQRRLADLEPKFTAMLSNRIFDMQGARLSHLHWRRFDRRYYGCRRQKAGPRYRADDLENAVISLIAGQAAGTSSSELTETARGIQRVEVDKTALRVTTTSGLILTGSHASLATRPLTASATMEDRRMTPPLET